MKAATASKGWTRRPAERSAAQDLTLLYRVVRDLANSWLWPEWTVEAEFRAVRDESADQRAD